MNKVALTKIITSLPYCLYKVDSRFFNLNDGSNSKIRFSKIETVPNRRTGGAKNVEMIRDRWGIDAHTDVEIHTDKYFGDDHKKAENWVLGVINIFIKRYRYYDKDAVHLVPLTTEDLFGFNILSDGKGTTSISFGGGFKINDPLLNHEVSNIIEKSIKDKEEIPLWSDLLLNAEQYLYQADYRHCVLESVIALELVISEFIVKKCKEKGITENEAEDFIRNVGLTGNVKVSVKLLLENTTLPSEDAFDKCQSGITIRNAIVHKGRNSVARKEAEDTFKYGQEMMKFLSKFLN